VNRIALIGFSVVGVAFGVWSAIDCAAIRFGYVAGYSYLLAVSLAIVCCCVGLPLSIWWRTRGIGVGLIAAGLLSCAMFYGGMSVLWRLDRVAWRHERPVKMSLSDKASVVVYLRRGITENEVEEFRSSVLAEAGNKNELPSFVRVYWRLIPEQANDQWGIALYFSDQARPMELTNYVEKIKRDSRVDAVYTNVAPDAIQPQLNHPATPVSSR
jgi:hypothetical protein